MWEYSPGCNFIPNNNSALYEDEFVRRAVEELLTKRCILKVHSLLYCCNPLTVVRAKKLRVVIALSRSVNKNLQSCKFKYEGLPTLSEMFGKEFWFITFDLESGYYHIDIDPKSWQLSGFFRSLSIFTTRQIQSQKKRAVPLAHRVATICRFQSFAFRFVLGILPRY